MADAFDTFVDELINNPEPVATKASSNEQRFPCGQCGGTGRWAGGSNRNGRSHCFACNGKGYFKTDPRKLKQQRAQRAAGKAERLAEAQRAFNEAHPGLHQFLSEAGDWSDFARSLSEQLGRKGTLSERQIASAKGMREKVEARKAARAQERKASTVEVDLGPIRAMFDQAVASGYKRPTYRAEGLVINRAPDTGRNPGALYVKNESDLYGGKVLGTDFQPSRDGRANDFTSMGDAATALASIAADPLAAALRYGQRTGRCACCGRELTNHASIEAGIGPICKAKWGL